MNSESENKRALIFNKLEQFYYIVLKYPLFPQLIAVPGRRVPYFSENNII